MFVSETPAPDPAAVAIIALAGHAHVDDVWPYAAAAALAREYEFCPPGTLAELERLRAIERRAGSVALDGGVLGPVGVAAGRYILDAAPAARDPRDDELERLRAVLEAVLEVHHERDDWPDCVGCGCAWPCPTARALDAAPAGGGA